MSESGADERAEKVIRALEQEQQSERAELAEDLAKERRVSERLAELLSDPNRPKPT